MGRCKRAVSRLCVVYVEGLKIGTVATLAVKRYILTLVLTCYRIVLFIKQYSAPPIASTLTVKNSCSFRAYMSRASHSCRMLNLSFVFTLQFRFQFT